MTGSSPSQPESFLPLKPVVMHILLALAEQELHGYGVIRAVRHHSGGCIELQTGSFYRHLKKLLDAGLVAEAAGRPPEKDPRRGAYYRITALGRLTLGAEARRLSSIVSATERLGLMEEGK